MLFQSIACHNLNISRIFDQTHQKLGPSSHLSECSALAKRKSFQKESKVALDKAYTLCGILRDTMLFPHVSLKSLQSFGRELTTNLTMILETMYMFSIHMAPQVGGDLSCEVTSCTAVYPLSLLVQAH